MTNSPVMQSPPKAKLARFDWLKIQYQQHELSLPYFYRPGTGGPPILFVHGLGGAKENFYAALQCRALAHCTIVSFDEPGTGLAEYPQNGNLDVSALADISQFVASALLPGPYFLAGASMGGLITLLQIRRHGLGRIQGLINLEGNLCPEDCMFSRRVVPHTIEKFSSGVFQGMMKELQASPHLGDRIVAQNMEMNVDVRAYHAYAFETVKESDSGRLMQDFLGLAIPRLFIYGEANRSLSYLPQLRGSDVQVREISESAHFMFYDNPVETFEAIGEFVSFA